MAKLIPALGSCVARMTTGERRFAERLEAKLEDDYLIWYDVPIGPKQRRPDFVILHPRRGILIIEVKDWKVDQIQQADREQFTLLTPRGSVKQQSPLLQALAYARIIYRLLEQDPALRHGDSSKHAGKLIMPWAYGVVLTHMTRRQFTTGRLEQVIPEQLVICQDQMVESVGNETFQEQLWAMFLQPFPTALTLPQIDRIRWHLFPEIRIEPGSGQFGLFDAQEAAGELHVPDLVKVMDGAQEMLARSLGGEHRIIHGVAGSGKTMILGFRATHLAQSLEKPVLVLCYNTTLAARLEQILIARGLSHKVQVYNFHRWCRQMLLSYHVNLPAEGAEFFANLPVSLMRAVDRGAIPRHQYGAVLVDEGHDFEPEWYRLIVQMIDPASNSLLVLYDDAQNIYGKTARRKVSWKSLGVQAAGRTTILRVNYRNTLELLAVARSFAADMLKERPEDDEGIPLIAPESAGRRGPLPELVHVRRAVDECNVMAERVAQAQDHGIASDQIAVLFRHHQQGIQYQAALRRAGIKCTLADDTPGKRSLYAEPDCVKLISMHSSKGLEFPVVLIPGLGRLSENAEEVDQEARLLYVAMTRATQQLLLFHSSESIYSERIRTSIAQVQAQLGIN